MCSNNPTNCNYCKILLLVARALTSYFHCPFTTALPSTLVLPECMLVLWVVVAWVLKILLFSGIFHLFLAYCLHSSGLWPLLLLKTGCTFHSQVLPHSWSLHPQPRISPNSSSHALKQIIIHCFCKSLDLKKADTSLTLWLENQINDGIVLSFVFILSVTALHHVSSLEREQLSHKFGLAAHCCLCGCEFIQSGNLRERCSVLFNNQQVTDFINTRWQRKTGSFTSIDSFFCLVYILKLPYKFLSFCTLVSRINVLLECKNLFFRSICQI